MHPFHRPSRLLAVVDRLAIASNTAVVGTRQQVLSEGPSKNNAARLIGQLLDIQIEQSTDFTLFGTACLEGR